MNVLAASAVDVAFVIAAALVVSASLSRASASVRHAVLAASILAASGAPLLELLLPQWPIPLAPKAAELAGTSTLRFTSSTVPEAAPGPVAPVAATPAIDWTGVLVAVWMAGVIVSLARLALGYMRLARLRRESTRMLDGPCASMLAGLCRTWRQPPVLLVHQTNTVLTWGLTTPRIVVPAAASEWTPARCRAVLVHELEHIRRGDWAVQTVASALKAFYWFNPLTWLAARRLREESELACDDAVLNCGVSPADYATDLLEIARHAVSARAPLAAAVGIAYPSTLERRVSIMLTDRRRTPVTGRTRFVTAVGALAAIVAVAGVAVGEAAHERAVSPRAEVALVPQEPIGAPPAQGVAPPARSVRALPAAAAQQPAGSMEGIVLDQTGAVLPGVLMTLQDTDFGVTYNGVTDGSGTFRFQELGPARYELTAVLPGFAKVENVMQLAPGAKMQRLITLPIGSVQESITVTCSPSAPGIAAGPVTASGRRVDDVALLGLPAFRAANGTSGKLVAAPPQAAAPASLPVRVGGQIKAPNKITDVKPVCPPIILSDESAVVILGGRIGIDGYLNDVKPLRGPGVLPAEVVESALAAARQWVFTPTLLNGQPVEVNITITILYKRS